MTYVVPARGAYLGLALVSSRSLDYHFHLACLPSRAAR